MNGPPFDPPSTLQGIPYVEAGTSLGQVGIRGLIIRFTVGSSSGSAVTVSAGLVPINFSTKTDSSIF